jgi:hypothetical protein
MTVRFSLNPFSSYFEIKPDISYERSADKGYVNCFGELTVSALVLVCIFVQRGCKESVDEGGFTEA